MNLADTGGWQNWVDYPLTLDLAQGTNVVRLTIEAGYSNYNYVDVQLAAAPTPTSTPTATNTPTATATATNTPVPTATASPTATPPPVGDISGVVTYLSGSWLTWRDVTVMLWDENYNTQLDTVQTDENGYYEFPDLPAGNYNVIVCGFAGSIEYTGERVSMSPPNPYVDIFAMSGTCPVTSSPPTTPETITVYAAGSSDGSVYPTMELWLDDKVVATYTNVQGDPSQRQFEAFTYVHNKPIDASRVKVAFTNDNGPRNLYVDKIVVGGVAYETEATTTYSTGTWTSGDGCAPGYKQSEVLACNGFFRYVPVIQRTTYGIAGQTIAVRVSGDPNADNNGLFYVYSDHLGSTSALVKESGGLAAGSLTRYLPFGEYRGTAPTQTITNQGFTGHKENRDIGLTYMNARFYVPGIGRFAGADKMVPGPTNPQSFNRYSYVKNNPIRFIDPSGHFTEEAIWNHIYNDVCYGSASCASNMMSQWKSDTEWWGMLRTAQAGDILSGILGLWSNAPEERFYYRFVGNKQSVLSGIIRVDREGNQIEEPKLFYGQDVYKGIGILDLYKGRKQFNALNSDNHIVRYIWGALLRQDNTHGIFPVYKRESHIIRSAKGPGLSGVLWGYGSIGLEELG